MKRFSSVLAVFVSSIILAGALAGTSGAAPSPTSNPPHCQPIQIVENSAAGPTYTIKDCGPGVKTPAPGKMWQFIVDGSLLPEQTTTRQPVVFNFQTPTVPAATLLGKNPASLPDLAGCFNHHGIVISGHTAYECIYQPSNLGGALYWSHNLNNYNWDKHPGTGLLWVEASTMVPNPTSNPPQPFQAFWVGIANNHTFCTVINPGYDQHPTQCEVNGVVQTMTPLQQASYDQFAKSMISANLPDCAWSQTISSAACGVT